MAYLKCWLNCRFLLGVIIRPCMHGREGWEFLSRAFPSLCGLLSCCHICCCKAAGLMDRPICFQGSFAYVGSAAVDRQDAQLHIFPAEGRNVCQLFVLFFFLCVSDETTKCKSRELKLHQKLPFAGKPSFWPLCLPHPPVTRWLSTIHICLQTGQ